MKGIKIHGGALFVKRGLITLKLHKGKWEPSPIMMEVLEWDLRTEPPETWDYIYDEDIASFGADTLEKIKQIAAEFRRITEN